jgi:hypothetical protein
MGTISNAQDLSEMLEVSSPSPAALLPACRHFGQLLSPWGGAGEAANDRASKNRRVWCRFGPDWATGSPRRQRRCKQHRRKHAYLDGLQAPSLDTKRKPSFLRSSNPKLNAKPKLNASFLVSQEFQSNISKVPVVITRSLQMIRMLDNKVLGFTVIGFRLTLNRSLQRMRMLDNEVALRSHPLDSCRLVRRLRRRRRRASFRFRGLALIGHYTHRSERRPGGKKINHSELVHIFEDSHVRDDEYHDPPPRPP